MSMTAWGNLCKLDEIFFAAPHVIDSSFQSYSKRDSREEKKLVKSIDPILRGLENKCKHI